MLSGRKFKSGLPVLDKASSDTSDNTVSPLAQPRNESQELLRPFKAKDPNFKGMLNSTVAEANASMPEINLDGCLTDPESNIELAKD